MEINLLEVRKEIRNLKKLVTPEELNNVKVNAILEIPEGRNYWEKEFKNVNYENKLKQYFKNGNKTN